MGQPVVHFEFWSRKAKEVADFYESVFDWKIRYLPDMNYHLVEESEGPGIAGGIMTPQEGPLPASMSLYIAVDEIAPYKEKIEAAGCKILFDEMEVPNVGTFLMFLDPDDRPIGIWKQLQAAESTGD